MAEREQSAPELPLGIIELPEEEQGELPGIINHEKVGEQLDFLEFGDNCSFSN